MPDLEQRITDELARRDALMRDELARHVAIPTGKGHVPGLDEYRGLLTERLEALGASIELRPGAPAPEWTRLPGSAPLSQPPPVLVATGPVRDGPGVLIAGHLDTVHEPDGPFRSLTVAADGATATGPGVVDMKGGVLITVHALEALASAGCDVAWTVALNSDEETGSLCSAHVLHDLAGGFDVGIAVEPALADGSLAVERVGSGQFRVDVHGRSAHAGREFAKGISAVTALAGILGELAAMARPEEGRIVNVGPLAGGSVTNAVPDHAAAWGNLRFRDAATGAALLAELDALATAGDALPGVRVDHVLNRPAKPLTPDVERLATLARSVAESLGQTLPFASTAGVCDGNILQDAGLPTLDTLGVRGGHLYRPDEFIELASLVERSQLLAVLLRRVSDA